MIADSGSYIASRIRRTSDGCAIWAGAFSCGVPKATVGRRTVNARRFSWESANRKLRPREIVASCEIDPRCVEPRHLQATSRSGAWDRLRKAGKVKSGKIIAARTTASARARSSMTIETVRRMRARYAEIGNSAAIAREFGISHSHAHRIVTWFAWREATPFTV